MQKKSLEQINVIPIKKHQFVSGKLFPFWVLGLVIFDAEYHKDLCEHIEMMVKHETISREDMQLLFMTDSVDDLVAHIKKTAIKKLV